MPHVLWSGMWYEGVPGVMENANHGGVMSENGKGWMEKSL